MECAYQYALEIYDAAGAFVRRESIAVDWEPAEEWARLLAVRKGWRPPARRRADVFAEPLWHSTLGMPYAEGFRLRFHVDGPREVTGDFTTEYFKDQAQQVSARLVASGSLGPGETFGFYVTAHPREQGKRGEARRRFHVERVPPDLPLRDGSLGDFLRRSLQHGPAEEREMPAFVPERVLAETASLARRAVAKETGGVLIGYLHRDEGIPELFAVVSAQIPARRALGEATSLRFTAETWTEVQGALDRRERGEVMLGWWHSHCVHEWCKTCPIERRRECPLSTGFFSAHDRALHRTVFSRAYSLALVVNEIGADAPTHSLFGWRQGLVRPRGFHVLDGRPDGP